MLEGRKSSREKVGPLLATRCEVKRGRYRSRKRNRWGRKRGKYLRTNKKSQETAQQVFFLLKNRRKKRKRGNQEDTARYLSVDGSKGERSREQWKKKRKEYKGKVKSRDRVLATFL